MDKLPINPVDLGVFAILLVSALLALFRGFVGLVLSTAGWIAAVIATWYFFPPAEAFARQYIQSGLLAGIAAGAGIFLPTLIFCSILTHLIAERVRSSAISAIDRSLGFLLGLARGALIVIVAFWVLDKFVMKPNAEPGWYTESRTRPLATQAYTWLYDRVIEQLTGSRSAGAASPAAPASPAPGSGGRPTPVPNRTPIGSGADSSRDSGYKTEERRGIESLIRTQDKP
ncbi:CvpA family protein [Ferrovibrio sp.]|uniref:CvpA family protein n=1 Tax=Ferrovibrio sp. TaxID=1917215 RepID=UPI003D0D5C51